MGPDDRSVRLAQVEDLPDVARLLDQFNREFEEPRPAHLG